MKKYIAAILIFGSSLGLSVSPLAGKWKSCKKVEVDGEKPHWVSEELHFIGDEFTKKPFRFDSVSESYIDSNCSIIKKCPSNMCAVPTETIVSFSFGKLEFGELVPINFYSSKAHFSIFKLKELDDGTLTLQMGVETGKASGDDRNSRYEKLGETIYVKTLE